MNSKEINYCVNCRYNNHTLWCHHPSNGINVVTGTVKPTYASWSRDNGGRCADGKLFEAIEINDKPWWKFWK